MFELFTNRKKSKRVGVLYILASISLLSITIPYLIPIHLKEIPVSTVLYDRNNIVVGDILPDGIHRHRNLDLDKYPQFLIHTIIAIEDKRFRQHNGIDLIALARATIENIRSEAIVQWASTITSQIARNQLRLNAPRTRRRKIIEFAYAYILDAKYSKKQLLSYYLNTLPLGYMNYGFETAAQRYFGKSVFQLSESQQLALITIMKNPVRYDPFKKSWNFRSRYMNLIDSLRSDHSISSWDAQSLSWDIDSLDRKNDTGPAEPYLRDYLQNQAIKKHQKLPPAIYTTIDDMISREVTTIANQTIYKLLWKDVSDYGVLIIDRQSNELRVMLGGMAYDGKAGQVNSTLSINQPGSAVKPFTYALAFQDLGILPSDTIIDEPVQFQSLLWFAYTPQDFSMTYQWPVTIAQALAQSLNIPAVKIAERIGVDKLLDFYHKVGLESLTQPADYYWLALTLWVGEVSLREMARGYGIFAHQWELCDIAVFSWQQVTCKNVIDPKYTDMVVDILSNRYNKMPSFPLFSNLDFPDRNVFIKSGTSRKFSDNRAIGFTDHYIIAIRIGNKNGANMKGVSGVSWAGDIFNNIVYLLEKDDQTPSYTTQAQANVQPYLHITKPLPQSIFSLDGKISTGLQWVKFEFSTNIPYTHYQWMIDKTILTSPIRTPQMGSHVATISLFSGDEVLQSRAVEFNVEE